MKHLFIIHGWGNTRAADHWQRHLATASRQAGVNVHYPQMPDTETPNFADWAEVAIAELEMIREASAPGDEVIVVTHSLGCMTWLRLSVDGLLPIKVDRLLMVAPPDPAVCGDVPTFVIEPNELVATAVKASANSVQLLGSDEDPWTPNGIIETFAKPLAIEPIIIEGAKHLALGDGWGHWQGVIDWVLEPSSDLTRR